MGNRKKPRYDSITATTPTGTERIQVSITNDGSIIFHDNFSNGYCEKTHEREGKADKVLSRVPQGDSNRYTFNASTAVERFNHLFAVDTNTKVINGRKVSVVGFVQIQKSFAVDAAGRASRLYQINETHCCECHNVAPPEENFGWLYAVTYILKELGLETGIGIIVDSDLRNLPRYNCQDRPFYNHFYLPLGITFIYASSDKEKREVINAAIAHADKASSAVLERLEDGYQPQDGRLWSFPYWLGRDGRVRPMLSAINSLWLLPRVAYVGVSPLARIC